MKRRLISLNLAIIMILTLVPTTIMFADAFSEFSYAVTLNGNGGVTNENASTKNEIITMTTPNCLFLFGLSDSFTKDDSKFIGWSLKNEDVTASDILYEEVWFEGETFDKELFAVWEDDNNKAVDLIGFYGTFESQSMCHMGATITTLAKAGDAYQFPSSAKVGCRFDGWLSEDGKTLYQGGETAIITESTSFTAQYTPLMFSIGGSQYDATSSIFKEDEGWSYFINGDIASVSIDPEYSGEPIYIPTDAALHIEGSIQGAEGVPAISVGGNAKVYFHAYNTDNKEITLSGGNGAPAISAAGELDINRNDEFDIRINLVGGGCGALSASSYQFHEAFLAGTFNSTLLKETEYREENYVVLSRLPKSCIIIDGELYDATQSWSGTGWDYFYSRKNDSQQLSLNSYIGGSIYSDVGLDIGFAGTNTITATDGCGILSSQDLSLGAVDNYNGAGHLTVVGADGYEAIKAEGSLSCSDITAKGGGKPALSAKKINLIQWWPSQIFVGENDTNATEGDYDGQHYVEFSRRPYSMTFWGNGGLTEQHAESEKIVFTTGTPGWLNLYEHRDVFSNNEKRLLGWSDSVDGSGQIYAVNDEYRFSKDCYDAELFAIWEDGVNKAVILNDFYGQHGSSIWHRGDTLTELVKVGEEYILPEPSRSGCIFDGWLSEDGTTIYPAGTKILVSNSASFTAQYSHLSLKINGEEYDASESCGSYSLGWHYYASPVGGSGEIYNAQLNIYNNYSGEPIVLPESTQINLFKSMTGTEGKPAISIMGDTQIDAYMWVGKTDNPVIVTGGQDAPAIKATGDINISQLSEGMELIFVGGGNNAPAIQCNNVLYTGNTFEAGKDADNLKIVAYYSNEAFVRFEETVDINPDEVLLVGRTIVPSAPQRNGKTFLGWLDITNGWPGIEDRVWYMPGDSIDAGSGTLLMRMYLDDNATSTAFVFDGNGAKTALGSNYYISLVSTCELNLYRYPQNPFISDDWNFYGYNTNRNGTGDWVYSGMSTEGTATEILNYYYAQWENDTQTTGIDSGSCGENASWLLSENTLLISGTGTIEMDYPQDYNYDKIDTIVIADGITEIGYGAFANMFSVEHVIMPDTVVSIDDMAFHGCESLQQVQLSSNLKSIGNNAFCACTSLESINLPQSLSTLDELAFQGCGLKSISIPESVSKIDYVFMGCAQLNSVDIPSTLTTIGTRAFAGCNNLTSVIVPESVTKIEEGAFAGGTEWKEIFFLGDAPEISPYFTASDGDGVASIIAHYPQNNSTWGTIAQQEYCGAVVWEAEKIVQASTVEGLIENIAPHTTIVLAPGQYNLSEWVKNQAAGTYNDYITLNYDIWEAAQREVMISNVTSLSILARSSELTEIITESPHAAVCSFDSCRDLLLQGLTMGHTNSIHGCSAAVLKISNCFDVKLSNLDLYGCGLMGLVAYSTDNLTMKNSVIHDCVFEAISTHECNEALFEGCKFYQCCKNNDEGTWTSQNTLISTPYCNVTFRLCEILHTNDDDVITATIERDALARTVIFEDCVIDEVLLKSLKANPWYTKPTETKIVIAKPKTIVGWSGTSTISVSSNDLQLGESFVFSVGEWPEWASPDASMVTFQHVGSQMVNGYPLSFNANTGKFEAEIQPNYCGEWVLNDISFCDEDYSKQLLVYNRELYGQSRHDAVGDDLSAYSIAVKYNGISSDTECPVIDTNTVSVSNREPHLGDWITISCKITDSGSGIPLGNDGSLEGTPMLFFGYEYMGDLEYNNAYSMMFNDSTGKYETRIPIRTHKTSKILYMSATDRFGNISTIYDKSLSEVGTVVFDFDPYSVTAKTTSGGSTSARTKIESSVSLSTSDIVMSDKSSGKTVAIIDLSKLSHAVKQTSIPTDAINDVAEAGADSLEIKMPNATVSFDAKTLEAIISQTAGTDINLTVSVGSDAESNLNSTQKAAFKDAKEYSVIDISLTSNGEKISDFDGGCVTIDIPFKWSRNGFLRAYFVDESGQKTPVDITYANGMASLTLTHFSTYVIEVSEQIPFTDVPQGEYYYDAVTWALNNNITRGTTTTTFAPDAITTRGQMVTLLWRAAGSPEPTSTSVPFTDIAPTAFYYKAALWAAENDIVKGVSSTAFSPNTAITRGQCVTFLARYEGVHDNAIAYKHSFNDVTSTDYFNSAVAWAETNGITTGTTKTTFAPNDTCTRGQIVTFLYRAFAK